MDAFQAYTQRRFFGNLDGIRAASILAVLWHHTVQGIDALPITRRGFLGVDMFFVLSGFLIVMLLLREHDRNGDISLKKFYMRRTLRIFPIYYALIFGLAFIFFFVARGSGMAEEFRAKFPFYVTYTSNWVHDTSLLAITWSLATEEQFYLVWPTIEKYLKKLTMPLLALFIFINQLINFGILFPAAHARLEILQSTFTPILFGVLLAHALHQKRFFNPIHAALRSKWSPVIIGIGLLVVTNLPPAGSDISGFPRLAIQLLMLALLASVVVREDHVLSAPFNNRLIVRIGQISYGMYLYHMLVRHVAYAGLSRLGLIAVPFALLLLTFIGTFIVSELSFRFVEAPFLKLKKRWNTAPAPQA